MILDYSQTQNLSNSSGVGGLVAGWVAGELFWIIGLHIQVGSIWFDFLDMSTKPLRGAYPNLRMVTPWSNPGPVISNTYCAYCLIRVFSRGKLLLSYSLTWFPGFFWIWVVCWTVCNFPSLDGCIHGHPWWIRVLCNVSQLKCLYKLFKGFEGMLWMLIWVKI